MALSWELCRDAFEVDGSLRDIYVLRTGLRDWQLVLDLLRERGVPMVFDVGGAEASIPDNVAEMFAGPGDDSRTLTIDLHGIQLNAHFFTKDEIELDLDPREVQDDGALAQLVTFMRDVARRVDKPVMLTPENWQGVVLLEVAPNGTQRWFPGADSGTADRSTPR